MIERGGRDVNGKYAGNGTCVWLFLGGGLQLDRMIFWLGNFLLTGVAPRGK